MLPFFLGRNMKFEDYYKEFCEVFGHPLWIMPMMMVGIAVFIETSHLSYHYNTMGDANSYCSQKEWVKDLKRFKENNAY